jgi:hypothetical protein
LRDLLTVLAGLVIIVLVAALVAPPFVDWGSQRAYVDAALTRATGLPVRTEGAITVRFLPTARLRVERLLVGADATSGASLDVQGLDAELAVTAILSGEIRLLETHARRMEIKLPAGAGADWRVPRSLVSPEALGRAWVFEDLAVGQLLLTTLDPSTGRIEQASAEQVGCRRKPWRDPGASKGLSMRPASPSSRARSRSPARRT